MSDKADRAKQFMPFAALKGYDELVKKQEKTISPRKEMSEYKADRLSSKLNLVKKGMVIKVLYYHTDGYIKAEGMVSRIDFTARYLTVIKTKIDFDDIYGVSFDDETHNNGAF